MKNSYEGQQLMFEKSTYASKKFDQDAKFARTWHEKD